MSKVREANGLTEKLVAFTDAAILEVIRHFTRESGVRSLERELASICRKVAREVVRAGDNAKLTRVTPKLVKKYLGVQRFRFGKTDKEDLIGVCTGLAYTESGGELLQTEVSVTSGKGKLQVTGRLGEVMQESANAAMSYIRSRSAGSGFRSMPWRAVVGSFRPSFGLQPLDRKMPIEALSREFPPPRSEGPVSMQEPGGTRTLQDSLFEEFPCLPFWSTRPTG